MDLKTAEGVLLCKAGAFGAASVALDISKSWRLQALSSRPMVLLCQQQVEYHEQFKIVAEQRANKTAS